MGVVDCSLKQAGLLSKHIDTNLQHWTGPHTLFRSSHLTWLHWTLMHAAFITYTMHVSIGILLTL
jgi:hypothetical protein